MLQQSDDNVEPEHAKRIVISRWQSPNRILLLMVTGLLLSILSYVTVEGLSAQEGVENSEPAAPTWTPLVVTSTPTPVDIFVAAGMVLEETAQAETTGTATPTPWNMVTATPTYTPMVVTNTPTAANAATVEYIFRKATAVALTTGTPDRALFVTATSTEIVPTSPPTITPSPTQPNPTATFTPIFLYVDQLPPAQTATPRPTEVFPSQLVGKILFLSDLRGVLNRGRPVIEAFAINPDGTELALLTSRQFYNRAVERDAYSPEQRFHSFARRQEQFGTRGRHQIYVDDAFYGSTEQVTFFGAGTAWDPAWSPKGDKIALVSNESSNDEIWIVQPGEWPAQQLTRDDYDAWDHRPSWSPDGNEIVFMSSRSGKRELWIMDADGDNQRPLLSVDFEAWSPVWVKYKDR